MLMTLFTKTVYYSEKERLYNTVHIQHEHKKKIYDFSCRVREMQKQGSSSNVKIVNDMGVDNR